MNVQDDTGTVASANSYLTLVELLAYWDQRNVDLSVKDDEVLEAALISATSYVDGRFRYRGRKLNGREQTTQWPRYNVYDRDRLYVNGVPFEVKDATAEYAKRALDGELAPDPEYTTTGAVVQSKSEKVGPIEESTTYVAGAIFSLPKYPAADMILKRTGFIESSGELRRG